MRSLTEEKRNNPSPTRREGLFQLSLEPVLVSRTSMKSHNYRHPSLLLVDILDHRGNAGSSAAEWQKQRVVLSIHMMSDVAMSPLWAS